MPIEFSGAMRTYNNTIQASQPASQQIHIHVLHLRMCKCAYAMGIIVLLRLCDVLLCATLSSHIYNTP